MSQPPVCDPTLDGERAAFGFSTNTPMAFKCPLDLQPLAPRRVLCRFQCPLPPCVPALGHALDPAQPRSAGCIGWAQRAGVRSQLLCPEGADTASDPGKSKPSRPLHLGSLPLRPQGPACCHLHHGPVGRSRSTHSTPLSRRLCCQRPFTWCTGFVSRGRAGPGRAGQEAVAGGLGSRTGLRARREPAAPLAHSPLLLCRRVLGSSLPPPQGVLQPYQQPLHR